MPLLNVNDELDANLKRKADRIMEFVMETGNFGHNRDLKRSKNFLIGKLQALWFKLRDFLRHARIFPLDSMVFFPHYVINGLKVSRDCKKGYVRKHCDG